MKKKLAKKARRAAFEKRPSWHAGADGRVHLAVHRDPGSGRSVVALETAVFQEQWQNELAAATANTAYASLAGQPTVARSVELGRSVMASTSELTEGLLARAPEGSVACKAGCDHCCYQAVGVTPPEALTIFDHLKKLLSRTELDAFAARLAKAYEATRRLSSAERFSSDHPCVFLESKRCSIYDVRPLSCRGMNSLDADECAKRLREPEARAEFLANGAGSRSYMEPIRAFHAVSAGLQLALSELYGLDMRPLDLIAAMHLLFSRGDSVARDWIAGQPSFEAARGGDGGDNVVVQPIGGVVDRPT